MSTIMIKVLMDLKKEFPINNITNRKRYSAEEINRKIDTKISELVDSFIEETKKEIEVAQ
jgi:hypothetical protein